MSESHIPNSQFRIPNSIIPTWLLLTVGIALRFVFQFLSPAFSGDEINLGNNIKHRGFLELLAPLDNFQSAPPLYLWLQKAVVIISPLDFWISIKLVSFAVSVAILFQATKLSRALFENVWAQILFLSFFVFSPSILYHTLTVKQYGFDLFFLLFALNRFNRLRDTYRGPLFFAVWCMFSNIGLFFAAAMGIYKLASHIRHRGAATLPRFLVDPKNILLALSPVPYVVYFAWFVGQPGAEELKEYMLYYWEMTFIPLDGSFFRYAAYLFDEVAFYFISPVRVLAYLMFAIAVIGIVPVLTRQGDERRRIALFMMLGGLVHAVLGALKMFPVHERFYLYESPLIYIFLISGLTVLCGRQVSFALVAAAAILGAINIGSIPFKQNDIVSMYRYLEKNRITDVAYSERAFNDARSFNEFTDSAFRPDESVKLFESEGEAGSPEREVGSVKGETEIRDRSNSGFRLPDSRFVVSRSHVEFRHQPKMVEEEEQILWLLRSGRLTLVHQTQGYKLYEVK